MADFEQGEITQRSSRNLEFFLLTEFHSIKFKKIINCSLGDRRYWSFRNASFDTKGERGFEKVLHPGSSAAEELHLHVWGKWLLQDNQASSRGKVEDDASTREEQPIVEDDSRSEHDCNVLDGDSRIACWVATGDCALHLDKWSVLGLDGKSRS